MLSIQREKRCVDAEVALRQTNADRAQTKCAGIGHHDMFLRVRRKLFLHSPETGSKADKEAPALPVMMTVSPG